MKRTRSLNGILGALWPPIKPRALLERLDDRLDLLLAAGGIPLGALIIASTYQKRAWATLEMGAAVLLACALYFLVRRRAAERAEPAVPYRASVNLALLIIVASSVAISLYLAHVSPQRPLSYFLVMSVAAAAIAVQILSSGGRSGTALLLAEILLISLVLRAGLFYEVPGFIGNDGWVHQLLTETWLREGQLVTAIPNYVRGYTDYAYFPLMHLAVIATSLVTSLNLKDSLFVSIGVANVVSILFVFFIARRLIGAKAGLLGALFVGISQPHIVFGAVLIPNALGLVFFTMALFLVLDGRPGFGSAVFFVLVSIAQVLTHTISAFITMAAVLILAVVKWLHERLTKGKGEPLNLGYNGALLFGALLVGKWLYSFYTPTKSFLEVVFGSLVFAMEADVKLTANVVWRASETILTRVWFLLFIFFVVIGSLAFLSKKGRDTRRLAAVAIAAGLSVLTFVFPFFGIWNAIPARWVPFVFVAGAAPAAYGMMALSASARGRFLPASALVGAVVIFSLFSFGSGSLNVGTPFLPEEQRIGFVQSELAAADTLATRAESGVTTDYDYGDLIFMGQEKLAGVTYLEPGTAERGVVVIRQYLSEHPWLIEFRHRRPVVPTMEETVAMLAKFRSADYNAVYDNGKVRAYVKR